MRVCSDTYVSATILIDDPSVKSTFSERYSYYFLYSNLFMVKLGISIKSSTYLIRRLLNRMTSRQGYGISSSLCQCRKSPFARTVTSGSTDSGQGKVTVESRDCRSTEREGLQWDKLSEDEKNIYLAHMNACLVSPTM